MLVILCGADAFVRQVSIEAFAGGGARATEASAIRSWSVRPLL